MLPSTKTWSKNERTKEGRPGYFKLMFGCRGFPAQSVLALGLVRRERKTAVGRLVLAVKSPGTSRKS